MNKPICLITCGTLLEENRWKAGTLMKQSMAWISAMAVSLSVLTGCTSSATDQTAHKQAAEEQQSSQSTNDVTAENWRVPEFTYTDQDGKSFGSKDLKGKVWLVDFIFTSCPDVCPPLTVNMTKIQKQLKDEGLDVQIVSFTVDPDIDKPEKLKAFGEKFKTDFSNWKFVTGYPFDEIQKMTKETFKGQVEKQPSKLEGGPTLIQHPVQFYLMDQTGKVRKFYNGLQPDMELVKKDVKEVLGK